MGITKMTTPEIEQQLSSIPGWQLIESKLHRDLQFDSFLEAFAFMTKAAIISEKLDHHPEWRNVYNRVSIDLTTHECQGISSRDFNWARAVNALLS